MRDKNTVSMKIARTNGIPLRLTTAGRRWRPSACIPASPRLDATYGMAVSMAIAQQTANRMPPTST